MDKHLPDTIDGETLQMVSKRIVRWQKRCIAFVSLHESEFLGEADDE